MVHGIVTDVVVVVVADVVVAVHDAVHMSDCRTSGSQSNKFIHASVIHAGKTHMWQVDVDPSWMNGDA